MIFKRRANPVDLGIGLLVIALAVLHQFGLTGLHFPGGHWELFGKGLHPFSLLYLVSGSLMISTIRVPKI